MSVWNKLTMNEAFYRSTDSGFSRSIVDGEGASISTIDVCFSKNKALPPGSWLVLPVNSSFWGNRYWSLLLVGWSLSTGSIQEPRWVHSLHPCCYGHFDHKHIGQGKVCLEEETDWHPQLGQIVPLNVECHLCYHSALVSTIMGHKYPILCQFGEFCALISSPDFLVNSFLILYLPTPWPCSETVSHCPWNSEDTYFSLYSLPEKWVTRCIARSSFHWKDFPSLPFFRVTLKWCYPQLLLEYNAESSVNKLWFCQYLVIGKSPWGYRH